MNKLSLNFRLTEFRALLTLNNKEQMIKLGRYVEADDKTDFDSFTIMDIEFYGDGMI